MRVLSAIWLSIWLFVVGCWGVNIYKLVNCDWSDTGTWKGEIVHAIGLVPIASVITVWSDEK